MESGGVGDGGEGEWTNRSTLMDLTGGFSLYWVV